MSLVTTILADVAEGAGETAGQVVETTTDAGWEFNPIGPLAQFLFSLVANIPKVTYLLCQSFFSILDVFQFLMRKLAGLDCYYIDGVEQKGDMIYTFLVGIITNEYPILSNAFWSIVILGFILLFLSTIIAIIRTEYTTGLGGNNAKGPIIGKMFKSVFYIAIVPIICIFGVYLANVVLMIVDTATSYTKPGSTSLNTNLLQPFEIRYQLGGAEVGKTTSYTSYNFFGLMPNGTLIGTTSTTFSGVIFRAAAYSANRVRTTENTSVKCEDKYYEGGFAALLLADKATNFNGLFIDGAESNYEKIATLIDTAFADNVMFNDNVTERKLKTPSGYLDETNYKSGNVFAFQVDEQHNFCNKFNVGLVWYFYDLWMFNFVIAAAAAIIMTTVFINIIFGLMKRFIELVGLFLMAPGLIGVMPLYEGAYSNWRSGFIKKTLMAFGAIGGINIVLLILPELQTITFFNIGFLDSLVDTLFIIVALTSVESFITLVSSLVGGEDANAVGKSTASEVGKLAAKSASMTLGVAGGVAGVGIKGAMLAGKGIGTVAGGAGSKLLAKAEEDSDSKIGKAVTGVMNARNSVDDFVHKNRNKKQAEAQNFNEFLGKKHYGQTMTEWAELEVEKDPKMKLYKNGTDKQKAIYKNAVQNQLKSNYDKAKKGTLGFNVHNDDGTEYYVASEEGKRLDAIKESNHFKMQDVYQNSVLHNAWEDNVKSQHTTRGRIAGVAKTFVGTPVATSFNTLTPHVKASLAPVSTLTDNNFSKGWKDAGGLGYDNMVNTLLQVNTKQQKIDKEMKEIEEKMEKEMKVRKKLEEKLSKK